MPAAHNGALTINDLAEAKRKYEGKLVRINGRDVGLCVQIRVWKDVYPFYVNGEDGFDAVENALTMDVDILGRDYTTNHWCKPSATEVWGES